MQENQFASPQPWSKKRDENNSDASNILQQENQKILLENAELKKKLEKEKLFHSTLYKQWTDLNASIVSKNHELEKLRSGQISSTPFYKYAFFGLLLITVILAVSAYNLSADKADKNISPVIQNIEQVPDPKNVIPKSAKTTPARKENSLSNKISVTSPGPTPAVNNSSELSATKTGVTIPGKEPSGQYRIISKSYFCNDPDENTRRGTFVLPDDSDYGILTALDDKNGFIYVVFTNHKGRISKGWISKSDLEPLH